MSTKPPTDASDNEDAATDPHPELIGDTEEGSLDLNAFPIVERDRYRVESELACNSLHRILAARDLRLDREVVIKELLSTSKRATARFVREATCLARCCHSAIVPIHELGRWPSGGLFYTMAPVRGSTLLESIQSSQDLEQRLNLLPVIVQVAYTIAYAHDKGLIHRNLKPSNILICSFGEVAIIGWDLLKIIPSHKRSFEEEPLDPGSHREDAQEWTQPGVILGTPCYMPLEQAQGQAVDERADIYALGAILYHTLAGAGPYYSSPEEAIPQEISRLLAQHSTQDPIILETLFRVQTRPPVPLTKRQAGIPPELVSIVNRAMSREPLYRYPTANELARDLRQFLVGGIVVAHEYSSIDLLGRWWRRHRGLVAFLLLLALLVGMGVRYIVHGRAEHVGGFRGSERTARP